MRQEYQTVCQKPKKREGKITLVLEGENVLETTSNLYQPLVSPNGENAD